MKKIWLTILTIAVAAQGYAQKYIQISNPTNHTRNELISIPYDRFTSHFLMDSIFTIKDEKGKIFPHQLEKLGAVHPVNVLVLVNIGPKSKLKLSVEQTASPNTESKTFARYVPERFDDFAWENDVLAFRMYGKALEGRPDDAQGMDVWAKRTDQLVIDKWYKTEDYHKDHGEGLDYYSVGQTLGAGDIGLFINDSLMYTKHYRRYKILDNGPLRTTFLLEFDPENVEGQHITFSKMFSLDAGSNFNKITLKFENQNMGETPIAIGIVKRKEENPLLTFAKNPTSLTYWEPEINNSGKIGVAVIVPEKDVKYSNVRPEQALMISKVKNEKDFIYYNGAAWNRAGKITNENEWNKAVEIYKENLKHPLKTVLK